MCDLPERDKNKCKIGSNAPPLALRASPPSRCNWHFALCMHFADHAAAGRGCSRGCLSTLMS